MYYFVLYLLSAFYLLTDYAFSYIDPGSGSYVLQIIIASLLGLLTLLKIYWSKLKTFIAAMLAKKHEDDE